MTSTTESAINGITQCATCAVEYDADSRPDVCPICADERQYVPADGQRWLDPAAYSGDIALVEREPELWGVVLDRQVGIGQQGKIIVTDAGTVMVDVPPAINQQIIEAVRALGPMRAIIASHPHMYGLQCAWSRALDDAPVYVSAADEHWLGRRPDALVVWDGEVEPVPGVIATQPGGHFPGSVVVHWAGADGAGVLLTGDTIYACPGGTAAFMRSYPNYLPLSAAVAERITRHVERYEFDRMYGNFAHRIAQDARATVRESADRHIAWINGDYDHLTI